MRVQKNIKLYLGMIGKLFITNTISPFRHHKHIFRGIKVRLNKTFSELDYFFGVSTNTAGRFFQNSLIRPLKKLITRMPHNSLKNSLPFRTSFREGSDKICVEIEIQKIQSNKL